MNPVGPESGDGDGMISINTNKPTKSPTVSNKPTQSPIVTSSEETSDEDNDSGIFDGMIPIKGETKSPTQSPTVSMSPTISIKFYLKPDSKGFICVGDCVLGTKPNCGGLAPTGETLFDDRHECCSVNKNMIWDMNTCMGDI